MSVLVSELYGKLIITTDGERLGKIEDVVMDFEEGSIAYIFTSKLNEIAKSERIQEEIRKNSIKFKRVKNINEAIVVGRDIE